MTAPTQKPDDYTRIELRHDPDDVTSGPIIGRILYVVVRGYLFVVMPSRASSSTQWERAALIKGSDYVDAKQKFLAAKGMTVSSTPASYLSGTSWKDMRVNNIATTANENMTLIEGFVDKRGFREMKVFSMSTLSAAYGTAVADVLALERRAKVGQKPLTRRKTEKRLPADVLAYLAARNLELYKAD